MTDPYELTPRLDALGRAMHGAIADDLAGRMGSAAAGAPPRRRKGRRLLAGVAAAVVLIPSAALAANALISNETVEKSIPAGTLALLDTHPTCTTVREGVEYDCTLANAPHGDVAPGQWQGTVEPTVDATKHVNGGCRSLTADGRHWRCYLGQEAVRQKIIGAGFLGESSAGPGVG